MSTRFEQLKGWEKIAVIVAIVNFVIFVLVAIQIGGDALNGKVENGHYLLSNHGSYTEVSRRVFLYSKVHASSVFVTHGLGLLVGFRAKRQKAAQHSN